MFFTQKNTAELSPAAAQIRTLEQNNEQRRKPGGNSSSVDKNDRWRRDMDSSRKHRGNKGGYKNVGNRGFTNPRQNMRRDYQPQMRRDVQADTRREYPTTTRFTTLADVPRNTCVKCLSSQHVTSACTVYPHAAICRGMCTVDNQQHGFHHRQDCVIKRNFNNNRGRWPRSNFHQNKDRSSKVFRPFRFQK